MNGNLTSVAELIDKGKLDEAGRQLDASRITQEDQAEHLFLKAFLLERNHEFEAAAELYEQVLQLAPDHPRATFRLAYMLDLRGDNERAIDLYEDCTRDAPAPVNALMNLTVLYEDEGRYADAQACLLRILAEHPNHERARLFLRDVRASLTMYYDEDVERARQEHSAIMDIPVSDFELSVRSRNCLKQMNIHTLGDLLRITEPELLAYKNFGETSLNEIKAMLHQKGLRLGQVLDGHAPVPEGERQAPAVTGKPELLGRSVTELELSARSRKCLQRLGITSLGELASRSEQELLAIKNFGLTSLNEIKRRLEEVGLSLRVPQK